MPLNHNSILELHNLIQLFVILNQLYHIPFVFIIWKICYYIQQRNIQSWLVWLSGLEHHPVHQNVVGSFPVRAHTQFVGSIPSQGTYGRQPIDVSPSHQCFSLSPPTPPLSLKINKHFFFKKKYSDLATTYTYQVLTVGQPQSAFLNFPPQPPVLTVTNQTLHIFSVF